MDERKTNFEQVPIEFALKAARAQNDGNRDWVNIAEQVAKEEDSSKLLELVVELNQALEHRSKLR